MGFPGGSVVKNPPANAGDAGSIPVSGRSPGGGNGNPLQYSCPGNPMDRGARRATVCRVAEESDVTEQLNNRRRGILEYVMKPSCNLKLFPNWLTSKLFLSSLSPT